MRIHGRGAAISEAQANSALAPLGPVFNLIDVALALFNAVKTIPDAISHPDPSKITEALPDLTNKAARIAEIVLQLSVPLMILGLIDALLNASISSLDCH